MAELDVLLLEWLPLGFRFRPTDEELVNHYLKGKINGRINAADSVIIPVVDICKCEPWDLPGKSKINTKDQDWYFFAPKDRKYPNGKQSKRATDAGYWKSTGIDRTIKTRAPSSVAIGTKKTLVFHLGRAPKGTRTEWIMHEYRTLEPDFGEGNFVLFRLFKKPIEKGLPSYDRIECSESSPILTGSSSDAMVTGNDSSPPPNFDEIFDIGDMIADIGPSDEYMDNINDDSFLSHLCDLNLGCEQLGSDVICCDSPPFDDSGVTKLLDAIIVDSEEENPPEFENATEAVPASEVYPIEQESVVDIISAVDDYGSTGNGSLDELTSSLLLENSPPNLNEIIDIRDFIADIGPNDPYMDNINDDSFLSYSCNLNPGCEQLGSDVISNNSPPFDDSGVTKLLDAIIIDSEEENPPEFENATEAVPASEVYPIEQESVLDIISAVDDYGSTDNDSLDELTSSLLLDNSPPDLNEIIDICDFTANIGPNDPYMDNINDDSFLSYSCNLNRGCEQLGSDVISNNSPPFDETSVRVPSKDENDENEFVTKLLDVILVNSEEANLPKFENATEVVPASTVYPIEQVSLLDTTAAVDYNNSAIEALSPQEDPSLEVSCQLSGPMRPSSYSMPPPSKSFIGLGSKFDVSMEDDADFDNDEAEFMNFLNENGMSASSDASNNLFDVIDPYNDLFPCGGNGGHDEIVEMPESEKNAEFGTPTSNPATEKASFGFSDNDDNASSWHAEDAKEPNDFCVKAEGPLQKAPRTAAVYFSRATVVIPVILCVLSIGIGWFFGFRS